MAPNDAAICTGLFQKTKLCKFKKLGICNRGEACTYAHSLRELQPTPDLYRTKMCAVLSKTGKCKDPKCPYAHSRQELRNMSFDNNQDLTNLNQDAHRQELRNVSFDNSPDFANQNQEKGYCSVFVPVVSLPMPWMGQYNWETASQSTVSGDEAPFHSPLSTTDSESFIFSRQTTGNGGEDASCTISQASNEEADTWGANSNLRSIENHGDDVHVTWTLTMKNTFLTAVEQDDITTTTCLRRCSSSPVLSIM